MSKRTKNDRRRAVPATCTSTTTDNGYPQLSELTDAEMIELLEKQILLESLVEQGPVHAIVRHLFRTQPERDARAISAFVLAFSRGVGTAGEVSELIGRLGFYGAGDYVVDRCADWMPEQITASFREAAGVRDANPVTRRVLYQIVEADLEDGDRGLWSPVTGTIYLSPHADELLETLLHEVIHLVLGHDGRISVRDHALVDELAAQFTDAIRRADWDMRSGMLS